MTHSDDEFTPRERGLLFGECWAQLCREGGVIAHDRDGREFDPVAAAAAEPPYITEDTEPSKVPFGRYLRKRVAACSQRHRATALTCPLLRSGQHLHRTARGRWGAVVRP